MQKYVHLQKKDLNVYSLKWIKKQLEQHKQNEWGPSKTHAFRR